MQTNALFWVNVALGVFDLGHPMDFVGPANPVATALGRRPEPWRMPCRGSGFDRSVGDIAKSW